MLAAVAAAQMVGILLLSLPMSGWVERFGPRRLFTIGSVAAAGLYLLLPQVPQLPFLLAGTALVSCCMPFRFVSLNTVFMGELERIGEARAGWFRGTHMVGMFLVGPMLAAGVVHAVGHAGSYALIAALFAVTVAVAPQVLGGTHGGVATAGTTVPRPPWRTLLRDPAVRQVALQEAAIQSLHMFYAFYIVVLAVQQLGLPVAGAGALVAVQGSALVAALFLGGNLARRLGPRAVPVAVAVTVLALACLGGARGTTRGVALLWLGGAVLGLGLGLLQIQTLTQLARLGARLGRSRMAVLNALVGPLGGLVGGLLGGTLGERWGLQTVFLLFVPVFLGVGWRAMRPDADPRVQAMSSDPR